MMIVSLLGALVGVVLGMRMRVFILYPVIAAVAVVVVAFGIADGDTAWSMVLTIIVAAVVLQLGYLFGLFARVVVAAARTPDRRSAAVRARAS
jgi:hypothetical protein